MVRATEPSPPLQEQPQKTSWTGDRENAWGAGCPPSDDVKSDQLLEFLLFFLISPPFLFGSGIRTGSEERLQPGQESDDHHLRPMVNRLIRLYSCLLCKGGRNHEQGLPGLGRGVLLESRFKG